MSKTSLNLDAAATKRELDLTINQRLNAQFTDRESGGSSTQQHYRDSLTMISNDISSFARFLTHSFCLEVLLFWKESLDFHQDTMWDESARAARASKIYSRYLKPGAEW